MKCQSCSNPATVHITTIEKGGHKKIVHLCQACAEQQKLVKQQELNLPAILQSLENSPLKQLGESIKAKDRGAFEKAYRFGMRRPGGLAHFMASQSRPCQRVDVAPGERLIRCSDKALARLLQVSSAKVAVRLLQ